MNIVCVHVSIRWFDQRRITRGDVQLLMARLGLGTRSDASHTRCPPRVEHGQENIQQIYVNVLYILRAPFFPPIMSASVWELCVQRELIFRFHLWNFSLIN